MDAVVTMSGQMQQHSRELLAGTQVAAAGLTSAVSELSPVLKRLEDKQSEMAANQSALSAKQSEMAASQREMAAKVDGMATEQAKLSTLIKAAASLATTVVVLAAHFSDLSPAKALEARGSDRAPGKEEAGPPSAPPKKSGWRFF